VPSFPRGDGMPGWVVALAFASMLTPSESAVVERGFFVEASRLLPDDSTRLGRSFAFGYALDGKKTLLSLRAGYRFGLPLDEAVSITDDSVVITSGGTLSLRAGTVAWLEIAFDGFRELAGSRMIRLDAVPGIRLQPFRDAPLDVGVGCLASFRRAEDEHVYGRSFAGVFQLSGRF
jgi:hypothetical protein